MANNKPYFTLLWVITLTIAGVFVLVGISLIPHFADIGLAATIMLYIFMGYATIAGGGFLAYKLYQWWNYRNLIVHGEIVAYKVGSKEFEHLSAQHVAAGVPRMLPAPADEEPPVADDATVIELYKHGSTLQHITQATGLTYYKVQKTVEAAKRNGHIG